ncbi:PP2C family protein-serine/threonine phosphatase [Streptomyces broussonetiae]|uniref:PP2C family protein-serine/threonine phosphatase n=1 Tax=Streptomyces broussonetiae TaxID=2686304 RepID=UPI0035DFA485
MSRPPCHLPVAHRYLAPVQDPGVGGDWYDIIPLHGHRTGNVVGDLMGRGLEAAAVMGRMRAASHALARTDVPPSRLMTRLDAFVADLADQLVTCVHLVVDQSTHEVTLCLAGHLPVSALPPDGPARMLQTPVGVPLGVNDPCGAGAPFQQATQPAYRESLDQTADLLIKTLLPDMATHDDDVTLLLIGLPIPKGEDFRA